MCLCVFVVRMSDRIMTDTNLSLVLQKKQVMELVDRPIPEPKTGEVQISMRSVGVCGTDVHFWQDGKIGELFVVKEPVILGHECSGVVSKVGEGVTHLKPGDRVSIEPHSVCRTCEACKKGRYNLCPNGLFFGTPPDTGGLARFVVQDADFVFKLPDNVSFEEGALIEPLSVGLHSIRQARVSLGDKVLVCGAGTIGLCAMLAAKAAGASTVCMTDVNEDRLAFAKQMGATHTVKVQDEEEALDVAKKIEDLLGEAPNRTIECSGAQFSLHLGVYATRPGGTFALVGLGPTLSTFPLINIIGKEIELIGCVRFIHTWPIAIDMISLGKINVAPLVSHRYKLEQSIEAFEKAKSGEGIKVMIDCSRF